MINSGKDKNHSEKNKRKTEKKSARISFEFFVENMLSGREQELAGRLREAASQVIGSDDEGHEDDEGDVGDDGDEMIKKLHFLTFMKKSSRVTRAWC